MTKAQRAALVLIQERGRLEWTPRGFGFRTATDPGVSHQTARLLVEHGDAKVVNVAGKGYGGLRLALSARTRQRLYTTSLTGNF